MKTTENINPHFVLGSTEQMNSVQEDLISELRTLFVASLIKPARNGSYQDLSRMTEIYQDHLKLQDKINFNNNFQSLIDQARDLSPLSEGQRIAKEAFTIKLIINEKDPIFSADVQKGIKGIPDQIDGINLSERDKQILLVMPLDLPIGVTYSLQDNMIIRENNLSTDPSNSKLPAPVKQTEILFNTPLRKENNIKFLQDQTKGLGFGKEVSDVIKNEILKGSENFSVQFPEEKNGNEVHFSLNFSKGSKGDLYFFNNFHVKLNKPNETPVEHTFQVNGYRGVTAREAVNILEGRTVKSVVYFSKNGEKEVLIQRDKSFVPETGKEGTVKLNYYSGKGAVSARDLIETPLIKLVHENYKEDAIKSLEKGNFVKVFLNVNGEEKEGLISLNAQNKNFDFYDTKQNIFAHHSILSINRPTESRFKR